MASAPLSPEEDRGAPPEQDSTFVAVTMLAVALLATVIWIAAIAWCIARVVGVVV